MHTRQHIACLLLAFLPAGGLLPAELPASPSASGPAIAGFLKGELSWTCGPALIAPVARPDDPYHAIKDPTRR